MKKINIENLTNFSLQIGEMTQLFTESLRCLVTRPFYFNKVTEQIVILGIGSGLIAIVIGLVTGLVMTLQFGFGLAKFGGVLYVPAVVSLSLTRELAPVFTSLLVAGRMGSGIAAELGSMNVSQQIDAIRALGTSPIRVLVVPRLLASVISLPLLTLLSLSLGLLGGLAVSYYEFNLTPDFYWNKVFTTVKFSDLMTGLSKTVVFAIIITIISCYRGMKTKDGTKGVGLTTTWVVVTSSIMILVSDLLMTKIFMAFVHMK